MVEAEAAVAKPPAKLQRGKTSAGDLQQSPVRRKKRAPGDAAAGEDTDAAALLKEPPKIPTYRQGDRVVVVSGSKAGIVEYVGEAKALGPGLWIGIQFDEPLVEAHATESPYAVLTDMPPSAVSQALASDGHAAELVSVLLRLYE